MNMMKINKTWPALVVIVALAGLVPFFTKDQYIIHVGVFLFLYITLASSLNIIVGFTGQPNFAHATFFGVGAYAAALSVLRFQTPFLFNLILAGIASSLFGLVIGLPSLRLKGHYLAIVTIGFGQIIRLIEINWDSFTGGPMGLPGIPTATIGGYGFDRTTFYYFSLVLGIVVLAIIYRLMNSRIGRALMSIRDDEMAAEALGVNTRYYKIYSFVLSTFLAGLCGAVYAHYVSFVSPDTFTHDDSITFLCMVVLGGGGTFFGPILGAAVLTLAPELFRFASYYRYIIIGFVMVVAIMVREGVFLQPLKTLTTRFRGAVLRQEN
ncbi:MAG: branched-chain amino acid ABC transporter permease [Firmicutes bacterium]|nr:branched-chain amino acid ABC transporter permease [Bacillota bacterium]